MSVSLLQIFCLLVAYQVKHLLADYVLQTEYMLGKFKGGTDWVAPLAAHAFVHCLFTDVIAAVFLLATHPGCSLIWALGVAASLGTLDFYIHFAMDRIKASPQLLGRYKALSGAEYLACKQLTRPMPSQAINWLTSDEFWGRYEAFQRLRHNVKFWWCLGLDQGIHHLTHYLIIAVLVTR